ncbi:hypothetical protein BH09SUM1_BH09SUM1_19580 [soil metagenome]
MRMKRSQAIFYYLIPFILAWLIWAIMTPNIFWAGTRAMQARTKADMRMLATALEAYHADFAAYPPATYGGRTGLERLTTPVSYVTEIPGDLFKRYIYGVPFVVFLCRWGQWGWLLIPAGVLACAFRRRMPPRSRENFVLAALMIALPLVVILYRVNYTGPRSFRLPNENWPPNDRGFHYYTDGKDAFILQSVGPDTKLETVDFATMPKDAAGMLLKLRGLMYDPSNGTISGGDEFRVRDLAAK